jgi:hypothetical protein
VWQFQNSRVKFALVFILSKWLVFGPFCFWNLDFVPKIYFSYFPIPSLRKERGSHQILVVERENHHWHWFYLQRVVPGFNGFHLMMRCPLRCSLTLLFLKMIDMSLSWFGVSGLILGLFKVIKGFIKVSGVFIF